MQFLNSVEALPGDDRQKIDMLWHQMESMKEDIEDEIRKLKRELDEISKNIKQINSNLDDEKNSIASLAARVTALEESEDIQVNAIDEPEELEE